MSLSREEVEEIKKKQAANWPDEYETVSYSLNYYVEELITALEDAWEEKQRLAQEMYVILQKKEEYLERLHYNGLLSPYEYEVIES